MKGGGGGSRIPTLATSEKTTHTSKIVRSFFLFFLFFLFLFFLSWVRVQSLDQSMIRSRGAHLRTISFMHCACDSSSSGVAFLRPWSLARN